MKGERSIEVFLASGPGIALLFSAALILLAGTVLLKQYVEQRRQPSRYFRLMLMMNLVTVMLVIIASEIALRVAVRKELGYEKIGALTLKPNNWENVKVRYRHLLDDQSVRQSSRLYEYDELLGWKIKANEQSTNGLYWSSSEGLRAPGPSISFGKDTAPTDIALVGDSFTFGDEVRYEETYGAHLERALGSPYRVLNFGVPGHGLTQVYHRYFRDVRPWKPTVVILGFISSDIERTMMVYPFLGIPIWSSTSSKPRVILENDELKFINLPPIHRDEVLSKASIDELPFLEYQRGYKQSDWKEYWYHRSYLVRLFVSWLPAWEPTRPEIGDEALLEINSRLLRGFVESATRDGSIPLVVFFPSKHELQRPSSSPPLGIQVLQTSGIEYLDATSCLQAELLSELYMPQTHYSPQGNAALAKCVAGAVNEALPKAR